MFSRRTFLKLTAAGTLGLFLTSKGERTPTLLAQIPSGTLNPSTISKYQTPMLIPPVMPRAGIIKAGKKLIDYYEISMTQFNQQILPPGLPSTKVWGYGAVKSALKNGLLLHNAPSLTIEARAGTPIRIKWINDLKDITGNYLPHLLPVDPTLHWANVPQTMGMNGLPGPDRRPDFSGKNYVPLVDFTDPETQYTEYTGPVPIVTHVHGAVGVGDESDGYTEAWFLPDAKNIPNGYATKGTWYDFFAAKSKSKFGTQWGPGYATFQYPNDDRASTNWYHDHALGMTRLNVYAGPAGFYNIRGGPNGDLALRDSRNGRLALLPLPAPKEWEQLFPSFMRKYREIPIAIQDRSFNADGSLFYPDTRAFFDGVTGAYIPNSDISPIWNPEFFGNTIMVNGNTWPNLDVDKVRYRFRFLNGCQSRFLILDFNQIPGVEVWQIGNEGGFLDAPVNLTAGNGNRLLMSLAERADVIVDFTNVALGQYVLGNVGPDEPFGGGIPGTDFDVADPDSTGQIMQFTVLPGKKLDLSTPPQFLVLPANTPLPAATVTRTLAMLEEMAPNPTYPMAEEVPAEALLGNIEFTAGNPSGVWTKRLWMDPITENPKVGDTELWELYNATADAHPMHIHEALFQVIDRQDISVDEIGRTVQVVPGTTIVPEPWETGFKDTVIAYPGQVTRVKLRFNTPGQYVWHCHIVEHEDNEMMRPYRVGPEQAGQPGSAMVRSAEVEHGTSQVEEELLTGDEFLTAVADAEPKIFLPFVSNQ